MDGRIRCAVTSDASFRRDSSVFAVEGEIPVRSDFQNNSFSFGISQVLIWVTCMGACLGVLVQTPPLSYVSGPLFFLDKWHVSSDRVGVYTVTVMLLAMMTLPFAVRTRWSIAISLVGLFLWIVVTVFARTCCDW